MKQLTDSQNGSPVKATANQLIIKTATKAKKKSADIFRTSHRCNVPSVDLKKTNKKVIVLSATI